MPRIAVHGSASDLIAVKVPGDKLGLFKSVSLSREDNLDASEKQLLAAL